MICSTCRKEFKCNHGHLEYCGHKDKNKPCICFPCWLEGYSFHSFKKLFNDTYWHNLKTSDFVRNHWFINSKECYKIIFIEMLLSKE